VPRVVKRRIVTHNPVSVSASVVVTRCGEEFPKHKGLGTGPHIASFGYTCPDCIAETARIKAEFSLG
jgi:hypothetical protein